MEAAVLSTDFDLGKSDDESNEVDKDDITKFFHVFS